MAEPDQVHHPPFDLVTVVDAALNYQRRTGMLKEGVHHKQARCFHTVKAVGGVAAAAAAVQDVGVVDSCIAYTLRTVLSLQR